MEKREKLKNGTEGRTQRVFKKASTINYYSKGTKKLNLVGIDEIKKKIIKNEEKLTK